MSIHVVEDSKCTQYWEWLVDSKIHFFDGKDHLKTLCKLPRMSAEKDEDLATLLCSELYDHLELNMW